MPPELPGSVEPVLGMIDSHEDFFGHVSGWGMNHCYAQFSEGIIGLPDYKYGREEMKLTGKALDEKKFNHCVKCEISERVVRRHAMNSVHIDIRKGVWAVMDSAPRNNFRPDSKGMKGVFETARGVYGAVAAKPLLCVDLNRMCSKYERFYSMLDEISNEFYLFSMGKADYFDKGLLEITGDHRMKTCTAAMYAQRLRDFVRESL